MIEKNGRDQEITIRKIIYLRLKIKLAHYCTKKDTLRRLGADFHAGQANENI